MEVGLAVEMAVAVAVLVLVLAWPMWRYWERRAVHAPKGAKPLPGSLGWPLLGESLDLLAAFKKGAAEDFAGERYRKFGDTFKSHVFGTPYVFVRGPEAVRLLAGSEDKLVEAHQFEPTRILIGDAALINMQGEQHKRYRRLFNDKFMGDGLRKHLPVVESVVLEALGDWKVGDVRVVKEDTVKFTYNVIAGVVFGWGPGPVRERSLELVRVVSGNLFKAPINLPGFAFNKAMRARKELTKMFNTEIGLRRHGKIVNGDLLQVMMEAVDPESDGKPAMSDLQLVDTLHNLILAGHETSTNTITWLAKFIHEHPHVKQQLIAEHQAVRSRKQEGEPLTWEELNNDFVYTSAVIKESLRVASLAFWHHRSVKQDFTFNGYHIPKGWNIVLDVHDLHHNPLLYPEPEEFKPSRFDEPAKRHTFMPFGTGPRICLGKDLAMMEVKVFLHHWMTKYSWSLTEAATGRDFSGLPVPNNGSPIRIEALLS